jgi:hypothetical protein
MNLEKVRCHSVVGLLVLLLGPASAVADLQRVEAVGSYGDR